MITLLQKCLNRAKALPVLAMAMIVLILVVLCSVTVGRYDLSVLDVTLILVDNVFPLAELCPR